MRYHLLITVIIIFDLSIAQAQSNDYSMLNNLGLYQKHLSPALGDRCKMHPSCSNYSIDCFKNYNTIKATILTADRLMRCTKDINKYPVIKYGNEYLFSDEVIDAPKNNNQYFSFNDSVSNKTNNFIKYLINNNLYNEALLEINRYVYDSNSISKELLINYILCYKALDNYKKPLFDIQTKFKDYYDRDANVKYEVGNLYFHLQQFEKAGNEYNYSKIISNDDILKDKCVTMQSLCYAKTMQWDSSLSIYGTVSDYTKSQTYYTHNIEIMKQASNTKLKKKGVAGFLSIIPGAGYIYSGYKGAGFTSLILNSLIFYATYSSFENENYGMAGLTSLFGLTFYVGNISGAMQSVERYNKNTTNNYINKLDINFTY